MIDYPKFYNLVLFMSSVAIFSMAAQRLSTSNIGTST